MCPFCMATSVWIAAGALSAGSVSVLAVAKLWNRTRVSANEEEANDEQ